MRIKKGDTVKVIAGKDKGKTGRVLSVDGDRVSVEGAAKIVRHVKPGRSQAHPDGGKIEQTGTLHVSNVMPVEPGSQRAVRVGVKVEGGAKVRIARGKGAGATIPEPVREPRSRKEASPEAGLKASDLRAKAPDELSALVAAKAENLHNLRMRASGGGVKPSDLSGARRALARAKTILGEKQRAAKA